MGLDEKQQAHVGAWYLWVSMDPNVDADPIKNQDLADLNMFQLFYIFMWYAK